MNEIIKEEINIESMIYEIRGKQVMLDSDLANLYNVETKVFMQSVKRNIERFPDNFMFQLCKSEFDGLRSQIVTSKGSGGRRYMPYVFTEQGIAMLSGILRSKIAINTSIKIMDAFVAMRHYIGSNEFRLSNIETKVIEHDNNIKLLQESFDKLSEKRKETEIYFSGQIYDAFSKILEIFKNAKKELIIIDSYADNSLLDIIKKLKIKVIIITNKDNLLTKDMIDKYNKQYNNLRVVFDNTIHDRYFILDNDTLYHCGTSINRIGYKTFSINLISDEKVKYSLINYVISIK